MALIGQAMGMQTIAWSPHLDAERAASQGVQAVSKAELFRRADWLSLHLVLSESTRHIVGADDLAAMQPHASEGKRGSQGAWPALGLNLGLLLSRKLYISWNFHWVSTCITGNGSLPGKKALAS